MIFNTYNSDTVARVFFNGYLFGSLFLGLISLYGFFSGAGILSTLFGFIYIVIVSLLSLNKIFRRSQFSIFFCFHTFLYLNIPAAFILFMGSDYVYGGSIESIPFAQSDYAQSLPLGFLYLSVCWVAVWLGIISANTNQRKINEESFSSIRLTPILLLGVIVFVVSWIDIQNFTDIRVLEVERVNSLLVFVFFDYAYLTMAGLVLFFKLNEPKYIINSSRITLLMSAIFIAFIFLFFEAGAKSAILAIFTWLVLFSVAFFRAYPRAQLPFLNIKSLVIFVFLSLPLFYFAIIQRMLLGSGIAPDLSSLLAGIYVFEASLVYDMLYQILYRFSQGGMDQFLLIFQSFVINTFDLNTASKFVIYLAKNTLNLILPGTPFPEAYVPSSQLFQQVIEKNLVGWDHGVDASALIKSLNTQPYTIFGVFIIIFGFIAPFFLYLFSFVIIFSFNMIKNIFAKMTMLYFFIATFASYGFEIAIGNSVHLFVSIWLMYFVLKIFSRFPT
jgi:hypothetical protein